MHKAVLAALVAPALLSACATVPAAEPLASTAATTHGAAAANDPRISAIGQAILDQGGNATDSALAMAFALTVIEPESSGIGGGAFFVRGGADGDVATIDGREAAPAAAGPNWFLGPDGQPVPRGDAIRSGLSTGVPGLVALAAEAHRRFGQMPWRKVIAPAFALARDGFRMNLRLHGSLDDNVLSGGRDPDARATYYGADGKALAPGTLVHIPALADTFARIAEEGPDSFYHGAEAGRLAREIAADTPRPAGMTVADFARYTAKERPPVCGTYRGYRICGMGPPSSGGVAVITILKQLERFDLAALGMKSPVTWHLFLESQRLAYADKEYWLADSDFVPVPLAGLLDPAYLASRSALIDPARTMPEPEPGHPAGAQARADGPEWPEEGTTHLVAADGDGNMVSITSTVEAAYGSGLFTDGFYLNNQLTDFTFVPKDTDGKLVANRVEGGKRPRSSMSPMVIYDPAGKPFMSVGAAGGQLIPVETAHAIIGVIDFHLPLEEALGLPFTIAFGPNVLVEKGTWLEAESDQLKALGHERIVPFSGLIRTTAALHTQGGWQAAMDPRLKEIVKIR